MALPQYGTHRQGMRVLEHTTAPHIWQSGVSTGDEEDVTKHELTDAERARTVITNSRTGVMSVAVGERASAPLGFVVPYGTDDNGIPLIAVRSGVEKSARLHPDMQICLAVAETPLTASHSGSAGGVSVLGTLTAFVPGPATDAANALFGRTQPGEASAVKRGLSRLFRIDVTVILVNAGTGAIARVDLGEYRKAAGDPLAAVAPGLVSHLASDENGSLVLFCRAFAGIHATKSAELIAIDQYGMDLLAITPEGRRPVRIPFGHPVSSPDEVRRELVAMTRGARFKLGAG